AVWVLPFALTTRTPNALTRHGELRVSDLMPGGFSEYVRLFHSVGRQEVDGARASFRQLRRVRWAALCGEVGLAFEATLSPQEVHDALSARYGVPHQWPFEQYGPVEGTLDAEQRQALVELLAGMTPRGEAWLAYYDPSALGWTRQAELRQGDPTLIEQLTRVDFGRLRVISNVRGAEVFVDDKKVGTTPGVFDLPAGSHHVVVTADDMKDWEETVDIHRGKETPVRTRLRPSMSRTGAWITGGLAVAALAGGIVLGILSESEKNNIESDAKAGTLASTNGSLGGITDGSSGAIYALGADVAFGAAVILGGLSIYYFVRDNLPDSEGVVQDARDWAFSPYITPNGGGAGFSGSF
ncbi:MAG: PEGA domain-containing protein, partial [Myxococcales bacterium]|nr:PEGA domain-containing protein [Myxococcales bacterium]